MSDVEAGDGDDNRHDSRPYAGVGESWMDSVLHSFRDEASIRHDIMPESDSDDDEASGGKDLSLQLNRRGDGNLVKGQIFANKCDFVEAVIDHSLKNCRNITQNRYDKTKIGFNCEGGNYNWRVYCVEKYNSELWEIRVLNDKHSCVPNGRCDLLKVPVIAHLFMDKLREEPEYFMPMKIQQVINQKWGITVSRPQCQAARNKALRMIELEYDMQFRRIREYLAEIMVSNPQSTVEIETLTNEQRHDEFNRFYVCFEPLKRSWKNGCRPVIGVDGCFLKSKMKGQLLVAIGRDPNNQIYPIAWGIVPVENKPNWTWFLKKLQYDLELQTGKGFVLISDRQKGLVEAVKGELPQIKHRMCVRHIYGNLKTKHGKKPRMKLLIWRLAWSYNEAEYRINLAKLMGYDQAVCADVVKAKPETWCRAFYKLGSHCEDVHNNFTESFNATIVLARERPIVPMLELIARQAMVRINTRSLKALEHEGQLTPYAIERLADQLPITTECRVFRSTNYMHQVVQDGCSYQVSLESWTCSCKKWQIRGIPCEHAYAVVLNRKLEVEHYVSPWYKTTTWRNLYSDGLVPARGAPFWPTDQGSEVYKPSCPPPQPGRKKKQKKKNGVNESPSKKQKQKKLIMHCSVCGSANHNSRKHKRKGLPISEGAESSQAAADSQPTADTQASQTSLLLPFSQPTADSQAFD